MYRFSTRNSGPLLALLGALLSGFAHANPDKDALIDPIEPVIQTTAQLVMEDDLSLIESSANGKLTAEKRTDAGDRAGNAIVAVSPNGEVSGATEPATTTAPPVPAALWIPGAAMIGLAAVGRRRAQPTITTTA